MALNLNLNKRSSNKAYSRFIGKVVDHVSAKDEDGGPYLVDGFRYLTKQAPDSDVVRKRVLLFPVGMGITDDNGVHHKITLFFTADNLYLIGYDDGLGNRYQFKGVHVLEGSRRGRPVTELQFDGTYGGLEGASGRAPGDVPVGKMSLSHAVLTLSGRGRGGEPPASEVARALLSLVIHISEACRFYSIENYISDNYKLPDGVTMNADLARLLNEWKALSKVLGDYAKDGSIPSTSNSARTPEEILERAQSNVRIMLNVGDWPGKF